MKGDCGLLEGFGGFVVLMGGVNFQCEIEKCFEKIEIRLSVWTNRGVNFMVIRLGYVFCEITWAESYLLSVLAKSLVLNPIGCIMYA